MAKWPYNSVAWRKVRLKVLKRDGNECQLRYPCCTHHATTADHIIPVSRLDRRDPAILDPANLQAACGECNSAKRDRLHGPHRGRGSPKTQRKPRRIPAATQPKQLSGRTAPPTPHPTTREW